MRAASCLCLRSPIQNTAVETPRCTILSDMAISLAKKHNCKARIMRLFPIYGPGEHHKRFFPSLKRAALKGKNFIVKNPSELTDFTKVDYATEALMDAINLKKNPFK